MTNNNPGKYPVLTNKSQHFDTKLLENEIGAFHYLGNWIKLLFLS